MPAATATSATWRRRCAQQHTIQALAITQSQHDEKLDRHDQSLTVAHGKRNRIIALLDRLLDTDH